MLKITYDLGDSANLLLEDGDGVTDGRLLAGGGDSRGAESLSSEAGELMLLDSSSSEVLREHIKNQIIYNYKQCYHRYQ